MEPAILQCIKCGWQGTADEVDWDSIETCMGSDKIEVCPICGSMEIYALPK
jgi:predicted RNA-binding Zn-ribbon protein involved in translation (DUF1610 family)